MSSTYRLLCLSHDPAIVLLDAEWESGSGGLEVAEAVAASPAGRPETLDHVGCDLVIGRYSYPLVEVGCPAQPMDLKPRHYPWHPHSAHWIDVAWLRLAYASLGAAIPGGAVANALDGIDGCWSPERLHRLRDELNP